MLCPNAPADTEYLTTCGVKLVCDLRGGHEIQATPNLFWQKLGVEILELNVNADLRGASRLDLMEDDPSEAAASAMMCHTYRALPRAAAGHLKQLFQRIAAGHLPLLVHCTAGKDRTGVVIALLLAALGTPRDAIYADYLESNAKPSPLVVTSTRVIMDHLLKTPISEEALQALTGVRKEYLEESFAAIDEEFGSIDIYLHQATGLTPHLRRQLRDILLV